MRRNTATIDMNKSSIEEALDRMHSVYHVQYKILTTNVTTQVVERHLVEATTNYFLCLGLTK